MRILPIININTNFIRPKSINYQNKKPDKNMPKAKLPPCCFSPINFCGVKADEYTLKQLAKYGITDIYNGKDLIHSEDLEQLLKDHVFDYPLSKLIPELKKKEGVFLDAGRIVFEKLEKLSVKHPDVKLDEALQLLKNEHEKLLLSLQIPVFESLIQLACDMPENLFKDFMGLIYITSQRIKRQPTVLPFSEKEFIYKLQQFAKQIKSKNNHDEVRAINNIIRSAKIIFDYETIKKNPFRKKLTREQKLEKQRKPEILKKNSQNFKYVRDIFEQSCLRNNKELLNIFNQTSAKIYTCPYVIPFKNQEFIYELEKILRHLKDKSLASKLIHIARKLPNSVENPSAFIVKYAEDTPATIGFSLFKDCVASVEHLKAKKRGGKRKLYNCSLCGTYINWKKTNMPFDDWCRKHPEIYVYCQKYVDRLIELYEQGVFQKIGLYKGYIRDFAATVKELSPEEKPMILDLSKLKD